MTEQGFCGTGSCLLPEYYFRIWESRQSLVLCWLAGCHSGHINSHPKQLAFLLSMETGLLGHPVFVIDAVMEMCDLDLWELENVKNLLGGLSLQENHYSIYREKQIDEENNLIFL